MVAKLILTVTILPLSYPLRVRAQSLSCVQLFATTWTVDLKAPLFMEFPRQECQSVWPFSPAEDLSDSRIKSTFLASPA